MEFASAILAGGSSKRMGSDKAFLDVRGTPLIRYMIDLLTPLSTQVVVCVRDRSKFEHLGVPVVLDRLDVASPMAGVHAALLAADRVFVTAVDMPYLNPKLVRHLSDLLHDADAVIPRSRTGLEPLCAFYRRSCVDAMQRCLELGFAALLDHVRVSTPLIRDEEWLVRGASPFSNINHPSDLSAFLRTL